MRTEKEIKDKLIDLLGVELEQRSNVIKLIDQLDKQALHTRLVEHHSQRGMAAALFWTLGYDFHDIVDHFVEPSVAAHERR